MTAPGTGLAVLTAASTVTCADGGTVVADSTTRLRVGKQPVLLADAAGKDIGGCRVVNDPSHGIKQCLKVSSVTGQSSKLTVGGKSVLLAGLAGFSDGTPPPTGKPLAPVVANQVRLRAAAAVA